MMNPFRETIVASPWTSTQADVPEINGHVFENCLKGIEAIRANHASKGLLIHGEAGSGKTHLLSRLRSQLMPELPSATDRDETLFIWVRLQTSPRMIWRTLRRMLVDDWFRPIKDEHTQFQRILFHRLAEYRPAEWDLEPWYEYMLDEDPEGLVECLNKIADELDLDRNTAIAFEHIAFKRHLRDLRAWLSGTSLPEATLERMGFTQDEGTDEEREDEARRVVLMLCRLAGDGLPIVLSFDQVEALQIRPGDRDALFAFGQLISTLHDGTTNVLLVSCVQSAFAAELVDHVRGADYDRMTDFGKFSLDPLNKAQAERLITTRLNETEHPPIPWPLSQGEFDELVEGAGVTPRKLLSRCAERFENPGDTGTISPPDRDEITTFLDETWESVFEEKSRANSADSTDGIIRHGLPLLAQIVAPELEMVRDEDLPDVALVFEGPRGHAGISVCTQSNMNSLGACLKRLKTQFSENRLQRLVIVRDSRHPISETAKATRKHLDELEQQGATILFPTVEALAALDALRSLLADAKSGDLSCRGEPVPPYTVEEWITSHLSGDLEEFVNDLLGKSTDDGGAASSDTHDVEALNELLSRNPVMSLEDAAAALSRPVEELTATVERHPGHFRVLGEPPRVMFQAVEGA